MPANNNIILDRTGPRIKTSVTAIGDHQGGSGTKTGGKQKAVGEVRIGTLNVGSMTGRGREVADMMARRGVNALCVQETRWKGAKAREICGGCKLFYYGEGGRKGVGIVLDGELKENVINVERISDRVIWMQLEINNEAVNIVSAYAPQVGCTREEKETFWKQMDGVIEKFKREERLFICADLNGHVGGGNKGDERWIGKHGYGVRNDEGKEIVRFATRSDTAVLNTFYKKREDHVQRIND